MSTTPIAKGRLSKLLIAYQTDFVTPAASGYLPTYFYTHGLREKVPLEDDPLIGGDFANGNDAGDPVEGLSESGGDIDVPLDLNHIGYWLKLLFGAPTTTGTTDKTHAFASGAATLPALTAEIKALAADYRQHVGLVGKSISIDIADAPGTQRAKLSLIGYAENLLTASGAGTPAAAAALDRFPAAVGLARIDGVAAGSVLSAKLNFDTGAGVDRYVDGDHRPSAAVLENDATLTGEIRLRHTGTTLETKATGKTPLALELEWKKSTTKLINFAAPRVFLERSGVPISGPGGIETTYSFRASQTAAAGILAVTLKNQIESY